MLIGYNSLLGAAASAGECEVSDVEDDKKASEEELIAAKKAKAKKKQVWCPLIVTSSTEDSKGCPTTG